MFAPPLPLSQQASLLFCLFAGSFELLAYAASDMIMPGMPGVVDEMGAGSASVPLALVCYLVGGVLAQWVAGPLSDDIGRRPVMLAGASLFALSCLGLSLVSDMNQFLGWRLAQGASLGIVVAVAYPTVQEAFAQMQALRVTAWLSNIALLSPMLAPLAGAAWLTHLGWRELFLCQGVLGALVTLGLFITMPETVGVADHDGAMVQRRRLSLRDIGGDCLALLRHRHFMACAMAIGLIGAPVVAWIALSPLLLMHHLGMTQLGYAQMQLPIFGALIGGNLLLLRASRRRGLDGLLRLGTWPLAGGAAMACLAALMPAQDLALVVLMAGLSLYAVGVGIVNTTLYRLALFAPDSGTGTCAAMLGTVTVVLFCLGGLLVESSGASHEPACFGASSGVLGLLALAVLHVVMRQLADARRCTANEGDAS